MRKKNTVVPLAAAGAFVLIAVIVAASASSVKAAGTAGTPSDTVTVSGSSTIYASPDKAELHMAVNTKDSEAAKAQEKNTEAVNTVIDRLKELGVEEKSIVTSAYNIYQDYNYETSKSDGFTVSASLTVKDIEIDQAGILLSESVAAGVNEVQYISYFCSSYDEDYEKALAQAVAAAEKKAEVLAKAAKRSLGDVQSMTEGYQDTGVRYMNKSIAVAEASMDTGAAAVSLNPGDSEITANVTVTYYLN